jgi:hypothetical protein
MQFFDTARDVAAKCLDTKRLLESVIVENHRLMAELQAAPGQSACFTLMPETRISHVHIVTVYCELSLRNFMVTYFSYLCSLLECLSAVYVGFDLPSDEDDVTSPEIDNQEDAMDGANSEVTDSMKEGHDEVETLG